MTKQSTVIFGETKLVQFVGLTQIIIIQDFSWYFSRYSSEGW